MRARSREAQFGSVHYSGARRLIVNEVCVLLSKKYEKAAAERELL